MAEKGRQARQAGVLIVEDDADLRQAVCQILEEEGYRVRSAADGAEALAALEHEREPCLILLDLMMPGMNGWEFLERKNRHRRFETFPVVVVSAYLDRPPAGMPAFAAPHLKVDAVIRKPLDLNELVETVARRAPRREATSDE